MCISMPLLLADIANPIFWISGITASGSSDSVNVHCIGVFVVGLCSNWHGSVSVAYSGFVILESLEFLLLLELSVQGIGLVYPVF